MSQTPEIGKPIQIFSLTSNEIPPSSPNENTLASDGESSLSNTADVRTPSPSISTSTSTCPFYSAFPLQPNHTNGSLNSPIPERPMAHITLPPSSPQAPSPQSVPSSFMSPPICLLVGPSLSSTNNTPTPFYVHSDLLTSISPFFRAALGMRSKRSDAPQQPQDASTADAYTGFREAYTRTINFPEGRVDDFRYLLQWLYITAAARSSSTVYKTFQINSSICLSKSGLQPPSDALWHSRIDPYINPSHHEAKKGPPAFGPLVRLYLLSDHLCISSASGLRDQICDRILEVANKANAVPTAEDVKLIWEGTEEWQVDDESMGKSLRRELWRWSHGGEEKRNRLRQVALDLFRGKKTTKLLSGQGRKSCVKSSQKQSPDQPHQPTSDSSPSQVEATAPLTTATTENTADSQSTSIFATIRHTAPFNQNPTDQVSTIQTPFYLPLPLPPPPTESPPCPSQDSEVIASHEDAESEESYPQPFVLDLCIELRHEVDAINAAATTAARGGRGDCRIGRLRQTCATNLYHDELRDADEGTTEIRTTGDRTRTSELGRLSDGDDEWVERDMGVGKIGALKVGRLRREECFYHEHY